MFVDKAEQAELAGAAATIIYDHRLDERSRWIDMVGNDKGTTVGIPSVYMLGRDGCVRAALCAPC